MFSTAVTQSSPAFFTFLYSTRNDWMGKPRLPRGIQVTYADVSVAVETVGLSGASGAAGGERKKNVVRQDKTCEAEQNNVTCRHLRRDYPSETEERRKVRQKVVRAVKTVKLLVIGISSDSCKVDGEARTGGSLTREAWRGNSGGLRRVDFSFAACKQTHEHGN